MLLGVDLHHADVGEEVGGVVGAEERHQLHGLDSRARADKDNVIVVLLQWSDEIFTVIYLFLPPAMPPQQPLQLQPAIIMSLL